MEMTMKSILYSLIFSLGMAGCAQSAAMAQAAPAPPAVSAPAASAPAASGPTLTATEKVALGATFAQYTAAQATLQTALGQLHAIEADIYAAHPGYRFDEATGGLVKLPEVAKAKPGVKPVDLAKSPPK